MVDRELSVADKIMAYATDTVTDFFYLIAGATSILIGWILLRINCGKNRISFSKTRKRLSAPTLRKALEISEAYRDDASVDPSFSKLHQHESFQKLVQVDEDAAES